MATIIFKNRCICGEIGSGGHKCLCPQWADYRKLIASDAKTKDDILKHGVFGTAKKLGMEASTLRVIMKDWPGLPPVPKRQKRFEIVAQAIAKLPNVTTPKDFHVPGVPDEYQKLVKAREEIKILQEEVKKLLKGSTVEMTSEQVIRGIKWLIQDHELKTAQVITLRGELQVFRNKQQETFKFKMERQQIENGESCKR
jgi:hypothetical protein